MTNIEKKYILGYDNEGTCLGFFLTLSGFKKTYPNDNYCLINKELHSFLIDFPLSNITIQVDAIDSENQDTIIYTLENKSIFQTEEKPQFDLSKFKKGMCGRLKNICGNYITKGLDITLLSGDIKHFSFKVEDQINLKELVDNKQDGDLIFYHADGEYNTAYTYGDISNIYKTLYNNKMYNQIYTQVLCQWISNNFTIEMYETKEEIIDYGYTNDDITAEVNIIYEQQKLS